MLTIALGTLVKVLSKFASKSGVIIAKKKVKTCIGKINILGTSVCAPKH